MPARRRLATRTVATAINCDDMNCVSLTMVKIMDMGQFLPTANRRGARLILLVLILGSLLIGAGGARAAFDQAWFNGFPGGESIKVTTAIQDKNGTALGTVNINDETVEVAVGLHDGAQVIMWEVKNFRLSSIADQLDVFPLNEITMPSALMVLGKANGPRTWKVASLPGELKSFAKRKLAEGDTLLVKPGLNIFGRIIPDALPENTKDALGKFGIRRPLLLGGSIGNILMKPHRPVVDLYAELSTISYPKQLQKILSLSGSQKPILFIGTSVGSKGTPADAASAGAAASPAESKEGEVRFGVQSPVSLKVGKSDFNFASTALIKKLDTSTALEVLIGADKWPNALGIRTLDLENVATSIGLSSTGSVSFGLKGGMKIDNKTNQLAIKAAVNPATGLDPSGMIFCLQTPEVSLAQLMKISDIVIGGIGGDNPLAKAARSPGLYRAMKLDKLPAASIEEINMDEGVLISLSGPNASDTSLGIAGLGITGKGRLLVWNTELGFADVSISKISLNIKGETNISGIGPLKAPATNAKGSIFAHANLSDLPVFKLTFDSSILGIQTEREVELSAERIFWKEGLDFGGFASGTAEFSTTGKELSKIKGFTLTGGVEQDLTGKSLGYLRTGIKDAFEKVDDKAVDNLINKLQNNKKFFDIRAVRLAGEVTGQKDAIELSLDVTLAGKAHAPKVALTGLDKQAVGKGIGKIFKDLGSKAFAFKLPTFDKDIIRDLDDEMYFYEGNDCTQEIAGTLPYVLEESKSGKETSSPPPPSMYKKPFPGTARSRPAAPATDRGASSGVGTAVIKMKEVNWFQNDEARSVLLRSLKAGSTIVLSDGEDGSLKDDVSVLRVFKDRDKGVCIGSLENYRTAEDGVWTIFPLKKNGLDGKVSRVKLGWGGTSDAIPPEIVFYEGNNCEQGVKGSYNAGTRRDDNCKDTDRCSNDEIRSARIMGWGRKQFSFEVHDHPDAKSTDKHGKTKDDWAEIRVDVTKMAGGSACIGSFERDRNKDGVEVNYHKDNGLDGKISHIKIRP